MYMCKLLLDKYLIMNYPKAIVRLIVPYVTKSFQMLPHALGPAQKIHRCVLQTQFAWTRSEVPSAGAKRDFAIPETECVN